MLDLIHKLKALPQTATLVKWEAEEEIKSIEQEICSELVATYKQKVARRKKTFTVKWKIRKGHNFNKNFHLSFPLICTLRQIHRMCLETTKEWRYKTHPSNNCATLNNILKVLKQRSKANIFKHLYSIPHCLMTNL